MSHARVMPPGTPIRHASARGSLGFAGTEGPAGVPLPHDAPACWSAALDAITHGVLVVDAALRVVVANAAAETMASAGHGFRLRPHDARIGSACVILPSLRRDAAALAALVGAVALAGQPGGAILLHHADGAPAVAALVSPLPERPPASGACGGGRVPGRALILLHDLALSAAPRAELLRGLFGLTAKEAEVARMLAGGATKAAVAEARGLRETTVRTQVRAVLAKTGAANLRDLARMLAGLVGL
ncbi:helix-turn-helix transcriptional regulator [Falsiroseomonas oryziterrae]|uniref:helix-turn-helix transcriptional regulator n=1 Tax=Falsiroseomonas oryziterrae TaxID=2911368 RepID=UPI001F3236BD|nr:helix-turn-helix transcriptional regulator [Roseomonas sp. NPKOSM-4]